ncbi:hypothetical protein TIFTF001_006684 [Ficus carica]|uniref:Arf-GAP domain-containing protein n=1 Tax=Ficus carica TaxID=3494 RepID=A0AA87ZNK2_FICCA|nr:hypothetical protein TIFTF001_006684 [Ficus carica]
MAKRLKEDEKNERIIRELLKLPGNRRCINCNSLGPRYVCTNFWTFICTTCSGVQVKSVSVSKFTSQEVGALQGGNQRAKEFYLKDLNPQNFPDSSNIERLRDFIRHVYVERRYSGGTSHKPSSIKVESQKNGQYKRHESQIEVVGPKFGLSLQRASSSVIGVAISKNYTASTTRQISFNDYNWANFDQPGSNAKTISSEVLVNGDSNDQDVSAALRSSIPESVPGQYAAQAYGVRYPSIAQELPAIYQRPKSTNPFDVSHESTPVQSQTIPSMACFQLSSPPNYPAVQPQQFCTWRLPITAQTRSQIPGNMLYLGHEIGVFNTAYGSLYRSQETSDNLLVPTTQNSFPAIGGNPFEGN